MESEKIISPLSGYSMLMLIIALFGITILSFVAEAVIIGAILLIVNFVLILPGLIIINPNESKVLTLFGNYTGTVKKGGFFWVNPFTVKKKLSLKAFNLNGQQLKVMTRLVTLLKLPL